MGWVGRLWRGEVALRTVFWLYGVGGAVLIQAVMTPIELWPDRARALLSAPGIAAVALAAFAYAVFSLLVVWHSADRHPGSRVRAWIARIAIALILFFTVIDVAGGLIVAFGA